ncbi:uncharacterized protein si:dkey-9k7.3 [Nematolebias whitei]|uniref:uncharacterized protein si:dkey-9k7.3 n=1 Tax=Nematolebias whitei TaxID=451745 RepID=UPI001899061E|nr:uncharacterized protein si:dkey-9k7.3 [Nematolebias whitei]
MEFACSHVVCNWRPDEAGALPPPLPPRHHQKPRPSSLPLAPPVPPRLDLLEGERASDVNVNVVSLSVAKLVDVGRDAGLETLQSPLVCEKCRAALSHLSSVHNDQLWVCEFCGGENAVDGDVATVCMGQRAGVRSDNLYQPKGSDDDYENLENSLVVFCVDISGSMSVTTECTDGRANIGLGDMEQSPSLSSLTQTPYFYRQLALQAMEKEVIISIMSFKGTDCRLADIGRLADATGGRVNIVSIGTVASEIQSISVDNVLATSVTLTLLAPDGVYFPFEDDNHHKLVREIGNVPKGLEITFQFAVKPDFTETFLRRSTVPLQLQLSFKTRDQQRITRIITEQRPVMTKSRILPGRLNTAVLGVHCAQLCANLTMEGRVQEAQKQLKAQQDLLRQISKSRPIQKNESIYGNWMKTMTTICDDITTDSQVLSDEAAEVVYHLKRASSNSYAQVHKNHLMKRNVTEA